MGPDGSGFQSYWAFLAGTWGKGCFLISKWELFAYFHSCDNGPVIMEDSVPLSDVHFDGTVPRGKSGVCFIPGGSGGSGHKADSDSISLGWGLNFCIPD